MMNDVFDIMNGRFIAAGINTRNWGEKEKKLDLFLKILDVTEKSKADHIAENKSKKVKDRTPVPEMFISLTTLQSWRLIILSRIALTEEMFNAVYITVLTGRLNQDPIEVFNFSLKRNKKKVVTINFFKALFRHRSWN